MRYGMSTTTKAENTGTVTNTKLDAEVREKLITARVRMLLNHAFFGTIATRLELVNADAWCPTAATDGRKFYYNSEFVDQLSLRETEFLIGHELLHVIYDHMGRRGDNDPVLSNIAADYCVNADLIKHGIGEEIKVVQILHDPKYYGWSYEEVYDDLQQQSEEIKQQLQQMILDEHLDEEGPEGNESGEQGDAQGNSNSRPRINPADKQKIKDEIRNAVLQSAQVSGAGNVPAGVKRLIDKLTQPKLDWRELLQQQIQSTIKSDFSWMHPSKRSFMSGVLLPGMLPEETIDVAIAIDTSGSIDNNMLVDFLSEVQGIMNSYTQFNIKLWTFDTEVHNVQDFTSDNISEITEYEILGGGGTEFMANWHYMEENGIEPKTFIMFTDGYPWRSWGDENYCDTLFVIHGSDDIVPPFGTHTYYKNAPN